MAIIRCARAPARRAPFRHATARSPATVPPVSPALLATAQSGEVLRATTDPLSQAIVGAIILAVFALLVRETAHRVLIVFGAVALMLTITYLTPFHLITFEAAKDAIDLNVLFLLAGMMAVVGVLKTTGVFQWAVARLVLRARGRPWIVQSLIIWFTGIVSALADNVTTVIFLTPMALEIARRTRVKPAAYLLPMVMAANVGGAATLIGDPPNILIGSGAGLGFMAFVVNLTVPILIMMVLLEVVARRYFRSMLATESLEVDASGPDPQIRDRRLLTWSLWISALIFVGFATHGLTHMPVAVPALIGAAMILIVQDVLYIRRHRPSHAERVHGLIRVIEKEIEWPTLSFFAFLFIAVGAAVETGLIDTLAADLIGIIGMARDTLGLSPLATLWFAALVICWAAGILSALVDNIPFVAVSIPIVARLVESLPGETQVLWWALALGACLGGNGSPIGASANITVLGLAERAGARISFTQFLRHGALVTLLTLLASSAFLTGFVYLGSGGVLQIGLVVLAGLLAWRVIALKRAIPPASV